MQTSMQNGSGVETVSSSESHVGIPLTPQIASRIIRELFNRQPQWKRQDLAIEVERLHLSLGGQKGTQPVARAVKRALSDLSSDRVVYNVASGTGIWRRMDSPLPSICEEKLPDIAASEEVEDVLVIEESIGEGAEAVYLYFNPNDRELAGLKGKDVWECKVGKTTGDVCSRILAQVGKTALSRQPIVGLKIRCNDCSALEKALHASFRIVDCEIEESLGMEWFHTSPVRVKEWYQAYQSALKLLTRETN
jgi:T5orf172 domain